MSELPNTLQGTARKLVESHLHLVDSIARGVLSDMPKLSSLAELVSLGRVGLVEAGVRYDPRLGASFSTFATYRIRGAILDGIRKLMPLSRDEWRKLQFQQKANEYLEERANDKPQAGAEEVQALEDIAAEVTAIYITSLDAMVQRGHEVRAEQASPEEEASVQELCQRVAVARKKLDKKEGEFLRLCYEDGLSLTEAGRKCGFTKSWASRLHARLLRELARSIGVDPPPVSL
jgi:RNA polymerase sigma factor for flagellar operon FliA